MADGAVQIGVSRQDVIAAYRMILGREPESETVLLAQMRCHDLDVVRGNLLHSVEFRRHFPSFGETATGGFYREPRPVEVDVPHETAAALLDRTRAQWARLGAVEPFWSVLTHEAFRCRNLGSELLGRFYASGAEPVRAIAAFEARSNVAVPRGTCLEIGCGVGRVTEHLAREFEHVVAVDISPSHLAECRRRMEVVGLRNVEIVLVQEVEDFALLPEADLLFSLMVLQHNPPPVQKVMLDVLLDRVRSGGACLLQVATASAGGFSAIDWLASPVAEMDLHALPQAVVNGLLRRHCFELHETATDGFTGDYGSHTFFATRGL